MSIIEKTLRRIETERPQPAGEKPGSGRPSEEGASAAAPARPQKPRRPWRLYVVMLVLLLVLGGASALLLWWGGGSDLLQSGRTLPPAAQPTPRAQPERPPVDSQSKAVPAKTPEKEAAAGDAGGKAGPAGAAPAKAAGSASGTGSPAQAPEPKAAGAAREKAAGSPPAAAAAEKTEAAPSAQDDEEGKPEKPRAAVAPWISEGWQLFNKDGLEAGISRWEAGLRSLPETQPVLQVGVYQVVRYAEASLRRLGEERAAILTRVHYAGKPAYMLVTIPDPAQLEAERERITKHLGLAALLPTRKVSQLLAQIGKISVATVRSRETKPAPAAPRPARVDIPAAVLPPGIPVKASTALDLLTAARHAEQTGQIQEAERLLRRLVESYPEDEPGRIALARLVIQRGAYPEAVEILQPIFRAPPKDWEPWFWMGTAQLGLGQHALADNYLSQALAREGKLPQLWVQRAVAAQQQGDNTRALQLLREAERLDPALPEIQLNIAYSSDAMGNVDAAIQAYRSFLAMTEGKAPYVNQRREVLQRLSRLGY